MEYSDALALTDILIYLVVLIFLNKVKYTRRESEQYSIAV